MVKNTDDVNILEVSTPYQGFFRVDLSVIKTNGTVERVS